LCRGRGDETNPSLISLAAKRFEYTVVRQTLEQAVFEHGIDASADATMREAMHERVVEWFVLGLCALVGKVDCFERGLNI